MFSTSRLSALLLIRELLPLSYKHVHCCTTTKRDCDRALIRITARDICSCSCIRRSEFRVQTGANHAWTSGQEGSCDLRSARLAKTWTRLDENVVVNQSPVVDHRSALDQQHHQNITPKFNQISGHRNGCTSAFACQSSLLFLHIMGRLIVLRKIPAPCARIALHLQNFQKMNFLVHHSITDRSKSRVSI